MSWSCGLQQHGVGVNALHQTELHQLHNWAVQATALDFSGKNDGVLAESCTKPKEEICCGVEMENPLPPSFSHESPKCRSSYISAFEACKLICCCHHASPGSLKSVTSFCSCFSG